MGAWLAKLGVTIGVVLLVITVVLCCVLPCTEFLQVRAIVKQLSLLQKKGESVPPEKQTPRIVYYDDIRGILNNSL